MVSRCRFMLTLTFLGLSLAGATAQDCPNCAPGSPIAQVPGGDGRVSIIDTDYPYPGNAIFVAATGNDETGNGSEGNPYATIQKAFTAASPGATIVMREGEYRTGTNLTDVNKRVAIQPYPHEKVWFKGSLEVSAGWTAAADNRWTKTGLPRLTTENVAIGSFCTDGTNTCSLDPDFPMAKYREMVFINGVAQRQVATREEVTPGENEFWVDRGTLADNARDNNGTYVLGKDPTGQVVEVASRETAFRFTAAGSVLRGLGFLHYARWSFEVASQDMLVESNTVAYSAAEGARASGGTAGKKFFVNRNIFSYNGKKGFQMYNGNESIIENNVFSYNNTENFRVSYGAAGFKIMRSPGAHIRDNVFENNLSMGFWMDMGNYGMKAYRNLSRFNQAAGIYYEVSTMATIAGNVCVSNGTGIFIVNSNNVAVYNNTLIDNVNNILIIDDNRPLHAEFERLPEDDWNVRNIDLVNNLISSSRTDRNGRGVTADQRRTCAATQTDPIVDQMDYNFYYRPGITTRNQVLIQWRNTGCTALIPYNDLAAFQSATAAGGAPGKEVHGKAIDNQAQNPFFDVPTGNYQWSDFELRAGSPARGAGTPVVDSIAELIGVNPGVAIHVGAVQTTTQQAQTITFAALPDKTFGDAPFTLQASASSNLPVSFHIVSGPATLSGDSLTLTGTGVVVVKAAQSGNDSYQAAVETEQSFTVKPAGTGLSAVYFSTMNFAGPGLTRTDATINFDWGTAAPHPSIGGDTYSVRWTGQVMPEYSQTYTFYTQSDDGVRLWVNGVLLINNWSEHAETEDSGTITLQAGRKYDIKLEYYEKLGNAVCRLLWSSPARPEQVIPQNRLFPVAPKVVSGQWEGHLKVSVSPNPASEWLKVECQAVQAGELTLTFTSVLSQKSIQLSKTVAAGLYSLSIPISHLPNGLYYLTIRKDGMQVIEKVVVAH